MKLFRKRFIAVITVFVLTLIIAFDVCAADDGAKTLPPPEWYDAQGMAEWIEDALRQYAADKVFVYADPAVSADEIIPAELRARYIADARRLSELPEQEDRFTEWTAVKKSEPLFDGHIITEKRISVRFSRTRRIR